MAKRMLLDALINLLGEYIELSEENFDLSLAVWSGKIVLHDLKLKAHHFLRKLDVSIGNGIIRTLEIVIPWTALLSSPVKVAIDGVYLQVGPLEVIEVHREETRKQVLSAKLTKLAAADKEIDYTGEGAPIEDVGKNAGPEANIGMIGQWTAKIVDNIEITLKNVHVRYEDATTIPGQIFSAGFTLDSFKVSTCDDHWAESYVERDTEKRLSSVHKLLRMQNVGVYWNTNSLSTVRPSFDDWVSTMQSYVFVPRTNDILQLKATPSRRKLEVYDNQSATLLYILSPPNFLTVKLVHHGAQRESEVPKFDIRIDSSNVRIAFDKSQYCQILRTVDMISSTERKRQPFSYRPAFRPQDGASARAWWRYASRLIRKRKRYIYLVKRSKSVDKDTGWDDARTKAEIAEMNFLEDVIPLRSLIMFRHMAAKEMVNESTLVKRIAVEKERIKLESARQSSWWFWGTEDTDTDEDSSSDADATPTKSRARRFSAQIDLSDDIPISKVTSILEMDENSNTEREVQQDPRAMLFHLTSHTSMTLDLMNHGVPIVSCFISTGLRVSVSGLEISAKCSVDEISIEDKYTSTPAFPFILSVREVDEEGGKNKRTLNKMSSLREHIGTTCDLRDSEDNKPATFSISFYTSRGNTRIKVCALPHVFALNKPCIQQLLALTVAPPDLASRPQPTKRSYRPSAAAATAVAEAAVAALVDVRERTRISPQREMSRESDRGIADPQRQTSTMPEDMENAVVSAISSNSTVEVLLEAHAPKIIIPEDASMDTGFLLLDSGYLSVQGNIGAEGISWNVQLRDINAGLPTGIANMTALEELSLYLIKPFDISLQLQNISKLAADLSLDVSVLPELRGELNPRKLERLLFSIKDVTSTFLDDAAPIVVDESVAQNIQVAVPKKPSQHPRRHRSRSVILLDTAVTAVLAANVFQTPTRGQSSEQEHRRNSISSLNISEAASPVLDPQEQSLAPEEAEVDPLKVNVRTFVQIPDVVLDLTYDDSLGTHLVLSLRNMETLVCTRAYDFSLKFTMAELCIEDSLRAESQRFLASTPLEDDENLIQIDYIKISNRLSPSYNAHEVEINAAFANLNLNIDVNSVLHLKPFFDVLFNRNGASSPNPINEERGGAPSARAQPNGAQVPAESSALSGILIDCTMKNISLELLRTDRHPVVGQILAPAFSLQSSGMSLTIHINDLLNAKVKLFAVDIFDNRELSKDYSFRKIFCPVAAFDPTNPGAKTRPTFVPDSVRKPVNSTVHFGPSSKLPPSTGATPSKNLMSLFVTPKKNRQKLADVTTPATAKSGGAFRLETPANMTSLACPTAELPLSSDDPEHSSSGTVLSEPQQVDVLEVSFFQEAENLSHTSVVVHNTAAFVSLDTILDLVDVAVSNAYAILALFSESVDPLAEAPLPDPRSSRKLGPSPPDCVQISTGTVTTSVSVTNPRLILLDDPTTLDSQAIVGRCGIEVLYSRETRTFSDGKIELHESLHLTAKQLELFVLANMSHWQPQQVFEPFGLEFHLTRRGVNGNLATHSYSLDVDSVKAKVSINDILLLQSILARKSLAECEEDVLHDPCPSPQDSFDSSGRIVQRSENSVAVPEAHAIDVGGATVESEMSSPSLNVSLVMGNIELVAVNDFNGQNVPLLRTSIEGTTFFAEANDGMFSGEGNMFVLAEFFNSELSVWEPVVERWHPEVTVSSKGSATSWEFSSKHTLQFTISSYMLEKLGQTYHLLVSSNEISERVVVPEVLIRNLLGEPVELKDSDSESILTIGGDEFIAVPRNWVSSRSLRSDRTIGFASKTVELHFLGKLKQERLPVTNLPFNVHSPKLYNLYPSQKLLAGDGEQLVKAMIEPILEEVYELSRYDILLSGWTVPFLPGDPPRWMDTTESDVGELGAVQPPVGWEWLEDKWTIAYPGKIGVDIDEEGWEYAGSFPTFTNYNVPRTSRPTDTCRRRRWHRTRVLKAAESLEAFRPLSLVWDVQPMSNGSRIVNIRSSLQIENQLPFPIDVKLIHHSWNESPVFGPIAEGDIFCIPLLNSIATGLQVKPHAGTNYCRSILPCKKEVHDFENSFDIICSDAPESSVCLRMSCIQNKMNRIVRFEPYIVVTNRLLCSLQFQVSSSVGKLSSVEEMVLKPGDSFKVSKLNRSSTPKISLRIGCLPWSRPRRIEATNEVKYFELIGADGEIEVVLSVFCTENDHFLHVDVFSTGALVDRTNLNLSIWSTRDDKEMIRNAFDFDDASSGKMKRVVLSRSEKNRRARILRNVASRGPYLAPSSSGVLRTPDVDILTKPSESNEDEDEDYEELPEAVAVSIRPEEMLGDDLLPAVDNLLDDGRLAVEGVLDPTSLRTNSQCKYQASVGDVGDLVFMDSTIRWSYLPVQLRKQLFIRTATSDRHLRSPDFLRFDLLVPSIVLILVDREVLSPPKWLESDGFHRVVQRAIARTVHRSTTKEFQFSIHGKYFPGNSKVVLRGNWCKGVRFMYSVWVLPMTEAGMQLFPFSPEKSVASSPMFSGRHAYSSESDQIIEQVLFPESYNAERGEQNWIFGRSGIVLFHVDLDNPKVAVGVVSGLAWSEDISLNLTADSNSGSFEIVDWRTFHAYQLYYSVRYLPGLFSYTQQIEIMPRFCIVNCLEEALSVVQVGSRETTRVQPFQCISWHKSNAAFGTQVQFRCASSMWSFGSVDINEIGTSVLHLPRRPDESSSNRSSIIQVEVKPADPSEHCLILVVVWESKVESGAAMSIRNDTELPVHVRQAKLVYSENPTINSMFDIVVRPGGSVPFGWADPDLSADVEVWVDSRSTDQKPRVATVSMLKAGERLRLPDGSGRPGPSGEVVVAVIAERGGRTLHISRILSSMALSASRKQMTPLDSPLSSFGVACLLEAVGISLVLDWPTRREFLSAYIDGIECRYKAKGNLKSFELMVMDAQLDNYSETAVYPVLLKSSKRDLAASASSGVKDKTSSEQERERRHVISDRVLGHDGKVYYEAPLMQFSLIQENIAGQVLPYFKYAAFRVLPFEIYLDSSTIRLLGSDLLDNLKFVSSEEASAEADPGSWATEFSRGLVAPSSRVQVVDVFNAHLAAQSKKLYFEKLIVHPVKITLTLVQSVYPRKEGRVTIKSTLLNMLSSLAAVDGMVLKLNSFEVEDALETQQSLIRHICNKALQDLRSQLAQIAGSLTLLGSPMGFARKVGHGVRAFFYEPYQGLVHSPHEFVVGIGKGTSSLFTDVVSGAMSSTVAFVGTASKGISYISGDADYVRKREMKNLTNRAQNAGFVDSVYIGGERLVSGISSGIAGLVKKPMEGAKNEGLKGFVTGLGLGLVGAAVKPILGLSDGITSVATGIQLSVANSELSTRVRPARALNQLEANSSDRVLLPIDLHAAFAQEYIIGRARDHGYPDSFVTFCSLHDEEDAVILTEMYLFWRRQGSVWGRTWSNISHCLLFGDRIGVFLYGSSSGSTFGISAPHLIHCGSRRVAQEVYSVLFLNASRMGNPRCMVTWDICSVVEFPASLNPPALAGTEFGKYLSSFLTLAGISLDGALDGYTFGNANHSTRGLRAKSDKEMCQRAEAALASKFINWKSLDADVWRLLMQWEESRTTLSTGRISVGLLINRSESSVQLVRLILKHGRNMFLFGSRSSGYEVESRSLSPNGFVLIVIFAFPSSPLELGHTNVNIYTNLGTKITLSTLLSETRGQSTGGFAAVFLEKTYSDWWSKYVVAFT